MADTAFQTSYHPKDKRRAKKLEKAAKQKEANRQAEYSREENDRIAAGTSPNHRQFYEIEGLASLRKELNQRKKDAASGERYESTRDRGAQTSPNHRLRKRPKTLMDE